MESALPPAPAPALPPDPVPATWDDGVPRMSAEWLRKICRQSQGYESPELNSQLSLQYKGIRKIEGLQEYTGVKSMFLECNGIIAIENLEVLTGLVQLYLQHNCITRIENLQCQVNLIYLNLSHNNIKVVENLGACRSLETLNLASNKIELVENLHGLTECPSLKSIDVSCNYIEDGEAFMQFWPEKTPDVECLYLHHNACSRELKDYRRRVISGCKKLRFLDQRPVFDLERVGAEAWADGGRDRDAELLAQQKFYRDQQAEKRTSFEQMNQTQAMTVERVRQSNEEQSQNPGEADELRSREPLDQRLVEAELKNKARIREEIQAFLSANGGGLLSVPAPNSVHVDEQLRTAEIVVDDAVCAADEVASVSTASQLSKPVSPSSEGTKAQDSEEEGRAMSTEPFTWSNLRDHRLGRLVAANHYNFQKAADALTEEFMCKVSKEDCRRRYTELKNLKAQPKDATREVDYWVDAAVKQDASKWWLRQLEMLKKEKDTEKELRLKKNATLKQEIEEGKAQKTKVQDKGDREDPSLYYDVASVERNVEMDANYVARSQAKANSQASSDTANTSSLLSADAPSLLSEIKSDPSPAKADPCRTPKVFAPPQRPLSELGDLD